MDEDAPPTYTVQDAIIACGVEEVLDAQLIAADIFGDSFETCKDKTFTELDTDFKTFAQISEEDGGITLLPGVKNRIKAFVQWTRDEYRYGRNPSSTPFPVDQAQQYMRRYKTHKMYVDNSKTMAEAAKPAKLTSDTKWEDWAPTFLNYLRAIPGRDGVPLKYICRDNEEPDGTPKTDFLDEYVNMAPLEGEAFTIDSAQVHTFIVNFISGNQQAETKIQASMPKANGRLDYMALKEYYEGVGIFALDITKADSILEKLFYAGERKPTMWWDEFERQLTYAFTAYDKVEGRQVHSNSMKLRILVSKIKANFLSDTKAGINIELSKIPMTMTYEVALASFRNTVNREFPPQMGETGRSRRSIRQTDRRSKRSKFDRPPKGGNRDPKKTRDDSDIITLKNGKRIEYHPSFYFDDDTLRLFKPADQMRLKNERRAYNESRKQQARIKELESRIEQQATVISAVHTNSGTPPDSVSVNSMNNVSQVSQTSTMMGGRNEQARNKKTGQQ